MAPYTYEVTLEGDWTRDGTWRAEVSGVELRLRMRRVFSSVNIEGQGFIPTNNFPSRYDICRTGTFTVVMDVTATNAAEALDTAKRSLRRELRNLYMCRGPRITFL